MKKAARLARHEIARRLQDDTGSLSEAYRFTGAFFSTLGNAIAAHDKIKIHNFGTFRCIHKESRPGRNPNTGVAAEISARRVVHFIASEKFKNKMSGTDVS